MRSRNYCFTINNYTTEEVDKIKNFDCEYVIMGFEGKDEGCTPHVQGYVELNNGMAITALKKKFNNRAHYETRRGTNVEASDYCKKEGDFWYKGELKQQGERKDLVRLAEEISNGKTVDEIALENPVAYHMYGRTMSKLEDLRLRNTTRTEMTQGYWFHGSTGTGKSHTAMEIAEGKSVYYWINDNGWWDGYTGQEVVIMNDFRGNVPYNELLQMVDKWPYSVRRRGKEPMPFTSKTVIITSSLKPEVVYNGINQKDSIEQLERRFVIKEFTQKYSEGNTVTSEQNKNDTND